MSNNFDFRQHAIATVAALAVSATCVLGTVGPIDAGPGTEQVQLAEFDAAEADKAYNA